MRLNWFSTFILILFMLLASINHAASAETIFYVAESPIGDDGNDGLDPARPFETIQGAVDSANGSESDPVIIRIAAGIYNEQIVMDSWESLEGGWDISFSTRRKFEDHGFDSDPTISSIIDGESFRRCLKLINVAGVVIDGLTIQHGWGDDGWEDNDMFENYGGGLICINSSAEFKGSSFSENEAFYSGSALYSIDSDAVVSDCLFDSNLCDSKSTGGGEGGAIYHSGGSLSLIDSNFSKNGGYYNEVGAIYNDADESLIQGCRFSHNGFNDANSGGFDSGAGIINTGGPTLIINSVFENNQAEYFGAMQNLGTDVKIINCLFYGNRAGQEAWPQAGAIANFDSNIMIDNSTFVDNSGHYFGPFAPQITNSSSTMAAANSIFWSYDPYFSCLGEEWIPISMIEDIDSTSTVFHSNTDNDGYEGLNGNISQDPMFINTGWDKNGTIGDCSDDIWIGNPNYRLQSTSPCIDAGVNELPPDTTDLDDDENTIEQIPIDLDGNPRIRDGIVDIGAYEYVQPKGALKVTLFPSDARLDGAKWRVDDDDGDWHESGYTQQELPIGSHTVKYKTIPGWKAPGDKLVTIETGKMATITSTYTLADRYGLNVQIVGLGVVDLYPDRDTYYPGTEVKLSGIADTGWVFSGWSDDLISKENPETITMSSDIHTIATFVEDSDNDGVSNEEENSGPNGGDGNDDGILDSLQSNVSFLQTYNDQYYVALETPPGTMINFCQATDKPSSNDAPSNVEFPFGFFEFALEGVAINGSTTITLHLPDGVTIDTYYKFGPTPNDGSYHWYEFLYDNQTGAKINNNTIELNFVDSLRGDDDLTANGKIIDIGGPGINSEPSPVPVAPSRGGGGGCFIGAIVF